MTNLTRDALLHPTRLRIVQAMVRQPMTAGEVKTVLGDVAQATLYRHIKTLEDAGLIEVVEQRQVRGGVERTYGVVSEAVALGPDQLADADAEEHFRYFGTFLGTLLTDFATFLQSRPEALDLGADRVGYRQVPLWLSNEELDQMVDELREVVERRLENQPDTRRRRRLISTVVMPDDRPTG